MVQNSNLIGYLNGPYFTVRTAYIDRSRAVISLQGEFLKICWKGNILALSKNFFLVVWPKGMES